MAKANQYHRSGHTYRHSTGVKIPLKNRKHNKEKWKSKQLVKKDMDQYKSKPKGRGLWWKDKFKRNKEKEKDVR